jgi:hypothetical protein
MELNRAIVARILENGQIIEQPVSAQRLTITEDMIPWPRDHRGRRTVNPDAVLREAATGAMHTSNFPDLLRQGLNFLAMSSYAMEPVVYPEIIGAEVTSNKAQEEYLRDSGLGTAPVVPEGAEYPDAALNLDAGVIIKNYKRGFVIGVTEEMRRFDQLGKVEQIAMEVGRSLRITEEDAVLTAMTTAANYTHSNTNSTQFSPAGLITAYNALVTQKDNAGNFLGVRPNTLICGPLVYFAALQLLRSTQLQRVGGNTTNEVYGTGSDVNPFVGLVDTIIMTPRLSSTYNWILGQRGRGLRFQRVDPARVLPPEYYPENDTWKYYARTWFGFGFVDDRFWYYSTSSSAPIVS